MGGPQQQQLVLVGWARLELTRQERVVRGCEDHQRGGQGRGGGLRGT